MEEDLTISELKVLDTVMAMAKTGKTNIYQLYWLFVHLRSININSDISLTLNRVLDSLTSKYQYIKESIYYHIKVG